MGTLVVLLVYYPLTCGVSFLKMHPAKKINKFYPCLGDAGSFVSLKSFITVMVNFQGLFFLTSEGTLVKENRGLTTLSSLIYIKKVP